MNIKYAKERLEIASRVAGHIYQSYDLIGYKEGSGRVDPDSVANEALIVADAIIDNWRSDLLQTIDSMPDEQKNSLTFISLIKALGLGE